MKIVLRYGTGVQNNEVYALKCQICGGIFIFDEDEIIERSRGYNDATVECPLCKHKLIFDSTDTYMKKSLC